MTRPTPLLLLFGACLLAARPAHAERHLVIVVDTSSSMVQNDPQRYTMQLSQVLSDLVGSGDRLSVIRMPRGQLMSFCMERASGSLVLELDPTNRAGFKQQLDRLIEFDTGTFFAAPIRTAISLLPHDPSKQRMLLILADSGGLGHCESALTQELAELKRQGVTIAAINLGGSSGAFDSNPAFDFTTSTVDVQGLIDAVALVYQRFLGAKKVQTGEVQNEISVEIAPYVEEAFLVVAADGPIRAVEPLSGNPSAKTIDANHHGGGATRGLDQVLRGYRIVRLEHPSPGRWRFRASGVNGNAGWMLLQDSAVGARLVSPATVPKGLDVPLEIELFDRRTGQTITDHSRIPGLKTELEVDGKLISFRDDGTNGDRKAGDGILTATNTFNDTGEKALNVHLQSDFLDRRVGLTTKVVDAAWRLDVLSPKRAEVDRPVTLRVTLQPIGSSSTLQPPERIDVTAGNATATLHDSGNNTFTGTWTPAETGAMQVDYVPVGGSQSAPARTAIQIVGRLTFGAAVPVQLGRLKSRSQGNGELDLSAADVRGDYEVKVSSSFDRGRAVLEADLGTGWVPLASAPQSLRLTSGGPRKWPVRLRVGECPEACSATDPVDILVESVNADGQPVRMKVPVRVEIVPDPWLQCWWPVLALGAGALAGLILAHGFWSPSRFSPRLGVHISQEEDPEEGFFHPIRSQRGTGSGFYRDARVYICNDFRLAGRARNAIARLRADHKQVRIEAVDGSAVWRRSVDGEWEQIPPGESVVRFGSVYRNDTGNLFFELRNA